MKRLHSNSRGGATSTNKKDSNLHDDRSPSGVGLRESGHLSKPSTASEITETRFEKERRRRCCPVIASATKREESVLLYSLKLFVKPCLSEQEEEKIKKKLTEREFPLRYIRKGTPPPYPVGRACPLLVPVRFPTPPIPSRHRYIGLFC